MADFIFGLALGIMGVLLVVYLFGGGNGERKELFLRQCREAGGVPVFSNRAVNCATEGYIDLKFE